MRRALARDNNERRRRARSVQVWIADSSFSWYCGLNYTN